MGFTKTHEIRFLLMNEATFIWIPSNRHFRCFWLNSMETHMIQQLVHTTCPCVCWGICRVPKGKRVYMSMQTCIYEFHYIIQKFNFHDFFFLKRNHESLLELHMSTLHTLCIVCRSNVWTRMIQLSTGPFFYLPTSFPRFDPTKIKEVNIIIIQCAALEMATTLIAWTFSTIFSVFWA